VRRVISGKSFHPTFPLRLPTLPTRAFRFAKFSIDRGKERARRRRVTDLDN
jgi:hypothetical protein